MGDYADPADPGDLIRLAAMSSELYDEIVREERGYLLRLAERFDWPDEVGTIIRNVEGYNVGVLEQRLMDAARDNDWEGLIEGSARYLGGTLRP